MINQDERVQKVAKAIYEAGDGYMSGVRYDNPYVKGNVFREGKAVRQAEAAIAALAPDLPADLAHQLVDAGLPTELDALWDWCDGAQKRLFRGQVVALYRERGGYIARVQDDAWQLEDLSWGEGETPHIAVARLALALHAKAGV